MEIPYTGLRNLEKIDYGHIWGKSGLKAAAILTCHKEGVFIEVKKDIMEFVGPAYHPRRAVLRRHRQPERQLIQRARRRTAVG